MGLLPEHFEIFAKANRSARNEAMSELVLVFVITAIPFGIGLIAFLAVKPLPFGSSSSVIDYFRAVLLRGQLFLISVSFLATSLHRLFNSDGSYRRPDIINVFSMLLFGIIGIFYGINPTFAQLKDDNLRNISILFFVLSILFYYYTAVLAYERPSTVEKALSRDVDKLSGRLDDLRNKGRA